MERQRKTEEAWDLSTYNLRGSLLRGPDNFFAVRIVDKRKARIFDLPSFSVQRRCEMLRFKNLVCLCALVELLLNGELHVNLDVSLSFSVMVLVLIALLKR